MIYTKFAPFFSPLIIANTGLILLHFLFLVVDFHFKHPTAILKPEAKGWILMKEDFNLGFLDFQLKVFCCYH